MAQHIRAHAAKPVNPEEFDSQNPQAEEENWFSQLTFCSSCTAL